jgi:hypothetical protein
MAHVRGFHQREAAEELEIGPTALLSSCPHAHDRGGHAPLPVTEVRDLKLAGSGSAPSRGADQDSLSGGEFSHYTWIKDDPSAPAVGRPLKNIYEQATVKATRLLW